MSDALSKYAQFVDLLLRKTKEGKIPWEFDSTRNTASIWNGDVLLNLAKMFNENFEEVYTISLYNRSGDFLESFNDESLSEIETNDWDGNYFARMRDLYNLAMRQATGADKALDDFIKAVRDDDFGVPF